MLLPLLLAHLHQQPLDLLLLLLLAALLLLLQLPASQGSPYHCC